MSNAKQNSWLIRRDVNDLTIVVSANFIPKLEVFGVNCKVNGVPTDCTQADNPVAEALRMIEAAILEHVPAVAETVEKIVSAVAV